MSDGANDSGEIAKAVAFYETRLRSYEAQMQLLASKIEFVKADLDTLRSGEMPATPKVVGVLW